MDREELKNLLLEYHKKPTSKNQIRSKISEINSLAKKFKFEDTRENKLSLKFLLQLANLISIEIRNGIKENSKLLATKDIKNCYLILFQHFTIFDKKDSHPNISKLLDTIYTQLNDKSSFIFDLLKEFLLRPSTLFNKRNVIEFIQSSNINFNHLFINFHEFFMISDLDPETTISIENSDQVQKIINEI